MIKLVVDSDGEADPGYYEFTVFEGNDPVHYSTGYRSIEDALAAGNDWLEYEGVNLWTEEVRAL
jgi:hypothetical protein